MASVANCKLLIYPLASWKICFLLCLCETFSTLETAQLTELNVGIVCFCVSKNRYFSVYIGYISCHKIKRNITKMYALPSDSSYTSFFWSGLLLIKKKSDCLRPLQLQIFLTRDIFDSEAFCSSCFNKMSWRLNGLVVLLFCAIKL